MEALLGTTLSYPVVSGRGNFISDRLATEGGWCRGSVGLRFLLPSGEAYGFHFTLVCSFVLFSVRFAYTPALLLRPGTTTPGPGDNMGELDLGISWGALKTTDAIPGT